MTAIRSRVHVEQLAAQGYPVKSADVRELLARVGEAADEIARLNNAIAMTLDLLQKRHGSASYSEDVDAAEKFLKAQLKP